MGKADIDIKQLHQKQLEILIEFDRVCKKYNLTYFLAYGTLLGSVRHKGFIPWDDDIDTLMPYDDYVRLKSIPKSEWRKPFFFQSSETDKNYNLCFSKLRNSETTLITEGLAHLDINHGVDIDIYPLIFLADKQNDRKRQYFNTKAYMLLQVNEPPMNHGWFYYTMGKAILFSIPRGIKAKMRYHFLKQVTQYHNTQDCFVVNGNLEVMKQALSASWFSKMVDGEFEGKVFPIPIGATKWLKNRYGVNYMEPPPIEKRGIKLDTFVQIDLSRSYKYYRGKKYYSSYNKSRRIKNNRWVGKDGE